MTITVESFMNYVTNYERWLSDYEPFLSKLPDKRIFMLYSGGKDSSLAMDFMLRAGEQFGFEMEVHSGMFPVHRFTDPEREKLQSYWGKRGLKINWHRHEDSDSKLHEAIDPCKTCQKSNKGLLNSLLINLVEDWEKLVVVAGYSLWDIVSYSIEHMVSNIFSDDDKGMNAEQERRLMETAQRFYPTLKMKGGHTVFRPLIKVNDRDILSQIKEIGIPTLSVSCQFIEFRPKRHLMGFYDMMGVNFDYEKVLNFAKQLPGFPDALPYKEIEKETYFKTVF
jgi:tRNA(Ile)-lysidine synthase TilS/MesJ